MKKDGTMQRTYTRRGDYRTPRQLRLPTANSTPSLASAVDHEALRQELAECIRQTGPLDVEAFALLTCLAWETVDEAVRGHPWFECEADGWHLTDEGWRWVRQGLAENE